ncbi:MAG: hypothetical protein KBC56_04810 [Flavobacterium sp.]|nr:hypothetical protein [Flavobacterium sp.]
MKKYLFDVRVITNNIVKAIKVFADDFDEAKAISEAFVMNQPEKEEGEKPTFLYRFAEVDFTIESIRIVGTLCPGLDVAIYQDVF